MGLKELVAVAALALTSGQFETQQDKPSKEAVQDGTETEILKGAARLHEAGGLLSKAQRDEALDYWAKAEQMLLELEKKKPDIRIDVLLADIYSYRNKHEKGNELSDYEKAIPRWERVLKENEKHNVLFDKKNKAQISLIKCYGDLGLRKFNEAQILDQFGKSQETDQVIKEVYKIETSEQAAGLSNEKLRSSVELIEKAIQNTADAGGVGAMTVQFTDPALALYWFRRMVTVAPDKSLGYNRLVLHYQRQGKIGQVLDELKELKEVPEEVKKPKLLDAIIVSLDTARKVGLRPLPTPDPLENLQRAIMLYETSSARWSREMKKENVQDRSYVAALEEAFLAGILDYNAPGTDERRASALKRLEKAYNMINSGMNNELGTLDKAYDLFISRIKLKIEGSDALSEALKERIKKDY